MASTMASHGVVRIARPRLPRSDDSPAFDPKFQRGFYFREVPGLKPHFPGFTHYPLHLILNSVPRVQTRRGDCRLLGERLRPLRLTNSAFGCSRVTKHANVKQRHVPLCHNRKTQDGRCHAYRDERRDENCSTSIAKYMDKYIPGMTIMVNMRPAHRYGPDGQARRVGAVCSACPGHAYLAI